MKNIKRQLVYLLVLCFTFSFSCSEEAEDKAELKSEDPQSIVNELLDTFRTELDNKASNLFSKSDEVIVNYSFEMILNERTGQIFIANLQEQPVFPISSKESYKRTDKKYEVSCDKGGTVTKSQCDGKISCGTKVYNCLKSGGCATICQAPAIKKENVKFIGEVKKIKTNDRIPSLNIIPNDKFSSVKLDYLIVK